MLNIFTIRYHHLVEGLIAKSSKESPTSEDSSGGIIFNKYRLHERVAIRELLKYRLSKMLNKPFHLYLASCEDYSVKDIVFFLLTSQVVLHTVHKYPNQRIFMDS